MEIRFTIEEKEEVVYILAKKYNCIRSIRALDEIEAACELCKRKSDVYLIRTPSKNIYYSFRIKQFEDFKNIAKIEMIEENLYKAILL